MILRRFTRLLCCKPIEGELGCLLLESVSIADVKDGIMLAPYQEYLLQTNSRRCPNSIV
jgi:hypothetical protein